MAVVHRYIEILSVGVLFFLPLDISSSTVGDILRSGRCMRVRYSDLPQLGTKLRGEGILRMEDTRTSEEEEEEGGGGGGEEEEEEEEEEKE